MEAELTNLLNSFKESGFITILTGAGISAESGIPTFRGEEGYWKIGSKNYHPQEMATYEMFRKNPYEVWQWYIYRRGICNEAKPNKGHIAIVKMEDYFKERFLLITQNVDGLHIRAGNSIEKTWEIHGNINRMRCSMECSNENYKIPLLLQTTDKNRILREEEKKLLRCPKCSAKTRPHILWFDESYNEEYYRFESAISASQRLDLLIVIGTTGATALPDIIIRTVIKREKPVIMIDPYENQITQLIKTYHKGYYFQKKSGEVLNELQIG